MVYALPGIRLPSVPSINQSPVSSSHGDRRTTNLSLFLRKHSFSRKIFAGKSAYESDSPSFIVAATEKVLVPGSESDGSTSSTEHLEAADAASEDSQVSHNGDSLKMEHIDSITDEGYVEPTSECSEVNNEQNSVSSGLLVEDGTAKGAKTAVPLCEISRESDAIRQISIPPPGTGRKIYEIDPLLGSHREHLDYR